MPPRALLHALARLLVLGTPGCAPDRDEGLGAMPYSSSGVGSSGDGTDGGSGGSGSDTSGGGSDSAGSSGAPGSSSGSSGGDTSSGTSGGATSSGTTATSSTSSTGGGTTGGGLEPPAGESSGGSGGGAAGGEMRTTPSGVSYRVIAPGSSGPYPLMIVYSGVEGGATMTNNLLQVADYTGTGGFVFAVLDGKTYNGNGDAGAAVLDDVRGLWDIDNDRTYLLSESAGTTAGLELGFSLRPSWFAAYWANDVNAAATPSVPAAELGFAPWGNAGPGGAYAQADAIVAGMTAAGWRVEQPAPYNGPGSDTHGDVDQFLNALAWFPGRSRQ